jgi:2-iminobutanoate/2-iminopropanoate deaminase
MASLPLPRAAGTVILTPHPANISVNVYLHDIRDYDAMNAAYRGRFGSNPPVRATVACYGGIPGSSLVEIDCIAAR